MSKSNRQNRITAEEQILRDSRAEALRNLTEIARETNASDSTHFYAVTTVPALPSQIVNALDEAKRSAPQGRKPAAYIVVGKLDVGLTTRLYALLDITDDGVIDDAKAQIETIRRDGVS